MTVSNAATGKRRPRRRSNAGPRKRSFLHWRLIRRLSLYTGTALQEPLVIPSLLPLDCHHERLAMRQVITNTLALVLIMLWGAYMLYPTPDAGPFCAWTLVFLAMARLVWGIFTLRRVKTAFPIEVVR